MSSDIEKYKDIYINDMREHLQNINGSFVDLENDPENIDLLNEIFRAAHTIKGNSATMGYHDVAGLAHEMENLLGKIRNKEITIDQKIMDTLFESFDAMESMIDSIANNEEVPNPGEIIEKINLISTKSDIRVDEHPERSEESYEELDLSIEELRALTDAINSGRTVYEILVTIDEKCGLKSAKAIIVIRNFTKLGERIAVYPPEEKIKETNPDKFHILLASESEIDILKESALSVSEISDVDIRLFGYSGKENIEFDMGLLDEPELTDEITSSKAGPAEKKPVMYKSNQKIQNVRVNIHQLDSLVNRLGELVINKISLEHIISEIDIPELNESVGQLGRIVEELHQEVMNIRMVPVDQLFNKYPRIIRDLSKNTGKKVRLVMEGGDIELDRTVLEGINDPLIHILRNSVDHGIETPQERISMGKPEDGVVLIRAKREKSHVIIEISDDGSGIAPDVVKESAISGGLISEEEAAEMGDDEIIYSIFSPGLSTSREITDISGRGVGMDVVKRDIERLGGNVKIFSTPGKGTRLELKLPLTLAIVKALVVRVGNEIYVLPLNNVIESAIINKNQIKIVDRQETIMLRDNVIPLIRLNELFEIESTTAIDSQFMVVVEYESRRIGLIVDELVDQQEVVIKSLGNSLGQVQGFAGSTIIRNGKVALILDINSLLNMI